MKTNSFKPHRRNTAIRSALPEEIKAKVHRKLIETMDLVKAQQMPFEELQRECSHRVDQLLNEQRRPFSAPEKQQLLREVMDEIVGLGTLDQVLRDPTVSDILVNGSRTIYIERHGNLESTDATFRDDAHVLQVIQRIAARVGRRVDESSPMLDARLADGSRVNAIIPPLAIDGPAVSLRRFGTVPINAESLVKLGSMTREIVTFFEACVRARVNILIAGGTGSGKTTCLNLFSKWIPEGERVVTIEDTAELQLQRKHVVRLESRPPNIEGTGEVSQRELLRNTLRMRPDRIIIGEVRGAEALDMLQAMNTGHEGSMTTIHANTSRDALRRVENMVSMAGLNFPVQAIRQQTASALDLVIHLGRVTGGKRKVLEICEVTGMEGDAVCLQEIFRFKKTGIGADGHVTGSFEVCGVRPHLLSRIEEAGIQLPANFFQRRTLSTTTDA